MTFPITSGSPRLAAASRFAVRLNQAMRKRQVGQHQVAKAARVARSAVVQWRHGRNLPTLPTALRLAEALGDEGLLTIVREARTSVCARRGCGRTFLHDGAGPKKYCSEACLRLAAKIARELKKGGIPAAEMPVDVKADLELLGDYKAAVSAMCIECEPGGYCRTIDCALRSVSPLPMLINPVKPTTEAVKPEGAWGPTHRGKMLAAIREAAAERWSDPAEHEAQSARARTFHDGLTEERRQEWIRSIREGRGYTEGLDDPIVVDLPFGKPKTPERNAYMRRYMQIKRERAKRIAQPEKTNGSHN